MDREQLIAILRDFAGPLGPFQKPEDLENRRRAWLDQLHVSDTDTLLDVLTNRPDPSEYRPATSTAFEWELVEALTEVGRQDAERFMNTIAPLLDNGRARAALIDVIGSVGTPQGIPLLERLIDHPQLSLDELTRLACSLGDIGGPDARGLLQRLREQPGAADLDVTREIDISLDRVSR